MEILVSIITPTYNSLNYLDITIQSIINQTYKNWELLITDDCSTDGTWEKLKQYSHKDSRIKTFKLAQNSGAGVARNNSIEHAKGRFIAFCDSDDSWVPEKLEKQIKFMLDNSVPFSYTDYEIVNEHNEIIAFFNAPAKITYKDMLKQDEIGCLTAIYDAEILGKHFMPKLRKRQDWALWLNILKKTPFAMGLKERLAIYKKRKDSISSNKIKLVKYIWQVYRYEQNMPLFLALYYLLMYPFYYIKKIIFNVQRL